MTDKTLCTIKVRLTEADLANLYARCKHDESLSDCVLRLIMTALY